MQNFYFILFAKHDSGELHVYCPETPLTDQVFYTNSAVIAKAFGFFW